MSLLSSLPVEATLAATFERVSVKSDGSQLTADPFMNVSGGLSSDGQLAVFITRDMAISPAVDANGEDDVYLRNRAAGQTELVSVTPGGQAGNGGSGSAQITPDGRFVVFASGAGNLVAGDTNGAWDVFVRDRVAGTTERVSVASDGSQGLGSSGTASPSAISADGRYVAFISLASNLVAGDGVEGSGDIFLHDRVTHTTRRISVAADGSPPMLNGALVDNWRPEISADGSTVAFDSAANNLGGAADVNSAYDVFLYDVATGTLSQLTNDPAFGSGYASVSATGRWVAYVSAGQIFIRDRTTGTTDSIPNLTTDDNRQNPEISADGRFVTFANRVFRLFVIDRTELDRYDRKLQYLRTLISTGVPIVAQPAGPMSDDGRIVAGVTQEPLVAGDTNYNPANRYTSGFDTYVVDTTLDPDPIPADQTYGGGVSPDLDANPCIPGRSVHGDPVNVATGALSESATDVSLPGPGVAFAFTRSYTSLDTVSGPLGPGWTHAYVAALTVDAAGNVSVRGESGQGAAFTKQPDGSFTAPPGVRSRLVKGVSSYTLSTRDHRVSTFDLQGRFTGVALRGQGVSFAYDGAGNLGSVTDSAGRVVTLTNTSTANGWRLTRVSLPDGRRVDYGYDAAGRLATVTDARGGVTTYGYDAGGRLASQLDQNNHFVFRNTYDGSGRMVSQQDARGNVMSFAWDQATQTATTTYPDGGVWRDVFSGNVPVSRTDPLGRTTTWGYDGKLNCTATTDPLGHTTTREYDARGNLTKTTSPAPVSAVESRTYDANDNLTSVTDPRGKTTTYTYDAQDRVSTTTDPGNGVTTVTYNAQSLPATVTNARGKVTSYGYDGQGNRNSVTTPLGKVTTFGFDGSGRVVWRTDPRGNAAGGNPLQFRTSFTYNEFDQVLSVTDALAHVASYTYDPVGNRTQVTDPRAKVTTTVFDEMNRPTSVTDPNNALRSTSYDAVGNVASRTSATGGLTTYAYDQARQLTGVTLPRGNVQGATAETYTWHYAYDAAGNRTTVTDPADKFTTTAYDNLNRPTSVTDPLGHATTTTYDAAGNVLSRTDGAGNKTTFGYDNLGRLDTVTSPRGNVTGGTPTDYQTRFVYDPVGNRTDLYAPKGGRTTWAYDDDDRVASMVDPRGYVAPNTPAAFTTAYTYDHAANLTRVTDPLGNQTNYTIDGANRQTALVDGNGKLTAYGYDQADQLTSVTGPDAPACSGTPQCVAGKAATVYTYDNAGRLTQRLDPKNHATGFEYDAEGRPTKRTDPLNRFWTYTYDPDGNPATTTTARGNASGNPASLRVTYTHDNVGRLTRRDYADTTPDVVYAYDDASRRATMSDGGGTVTYTYDNADRVTNISRAGGDVWAYQYDPDSDVTRRTYPDATIVDATFDRDGNLQSVVQGSNTTTFAYDAAGRLTTATLPSGNGYVESRAYDNAGRLTQVKNQKGVAVLSQFTRTLDPVGNPTLVATLRGSTTTNEAMQYDPANRLTKWCQAASCTGATKWISYAYDPVGNRTQQVRTGITTPGTTTYTYDNADQLTQTTVGSTNTTFTYDADGNQTAQGGRTFAYDLQGRMKSTTSGSTTTNYTYDGNDLRLTRATGATVNTRYSWDQVGALPELALERNASNALIRRYVQGPAGPISMATSATAVFYYHRDQLGTVTDLTSATGAAQWRYTYEPFGAQLTATKVVGSAPANMVRFTGEYQDSEWANLHLRARQYDPATGRFLATDPVDPAISDQYVSAYAYVNDRPGVLTDPSGLLPGLDDLWNGVKAGATYIPGQWYDLGYKAGDGQLDPTATGIVGAFAAVGDTAFQVEAVQQLIATGYAAGYAWGSGCTEEALTQFRAALGQGVLLGIGFAPGPGKGAAWGIRGARAARAAKGAAWTLPRAGGARIGGRWFTEHALERMAPRTPEVMADLERRALARAEAAGFKPGTPEFGKWWKSYGPDPRGIPPSVIEAEIANPGSTGVRVITNANGDVVTVIPGGGRR